MKKEKSKKKKILLNESSVRKQSIIDAYEGLLEPRTQEVISGKAQEIIKSDSFDTIEQDLSKVRELMSLWQDELDVREQDDEEAILMLM